MENYPIDKKLEYQRQALNALNNTIGWCKQVGITINLFMVVDNSLAVLTSNQIMVKKDRLELRENGSNQTMTDPNTNPENNDVYTDIYEGEETTIYYDEDGNQHVEINDE